MAGSHVPGVKLDRLVAHRGVATVGTDRPTRGDLRRPGHAGEVAGRQAWFFPSSADPVDPEGTTGGQGERERGPEDLPSSLAPAAVDFDRRAHPGHPWPIQEDRARRGERVFLRTCASCHGTYGEGGTYPNRIIDIEVVGTDRALADADTRYKEYLDWYNRSWFGRTSRLVETDGYIAPPLDGIWATAPYLHNGSVPTLYHLLKSSARPRFWERSFSSRDYDPDRLGWRFLRHRHGRDRELLPVRRSRIYDTSRFSLGNGGHTFGDDLTEAERFDLLEYLKGL